jgi:hypothetical protein
VFSQASSESHSLHECDRWQAHGRCVVGSRVSFLGYDDQCILQSVSRLTVGGPGTDPPGALLRTVLGIGAGDGDAIRAARWSDAGVHTVCGGAHCTNSCCGMSSGTAGPKKVWEPRRNRSYNPQIESPTGCPLDAAFCLPRKTDASASDMCSGIRPCPWVWLSDWLSKMQAVCTKTAVETNGGLTPNTTRR